MGQLDENVLERSPALSEFAHGPMTFNGEPEKVAPHDSSSHENFTTLLEPSVTTRSRRTRDQLKRFRLSFEIAGLRPA